MRLPAQLRVPLRPSRIATSWIAALAVVTFGLWLTLSLPLASDLAAATLLAGWAHHRIRVYGTRRASGSITEILLSGDATLVVRTRDGRLAAGHVRSSTFVHPWFTSVVWRPDGARWSRSVPLVPDMLDVDDFRRVRVLLRYGRREVTAAPPASHA